MPVANGAYHARRSMEERDQIVFAPAGGNGGDDLVEIEIDEAGRFGVDFLWRAAEDAFRKPRFWMQRHPLLVRLQGALRTCAVGSRVSLIRYHGTFGHGSLI
ncbi:hypothetical protein [Mesorhizobium sp. M1D.F.Ca.ET.043.01.1.1]|uniref:hypothetical protein n=1 Tax=Mesorhizobium sp. M1D.F.Ca.ET.043.01.1.1 TaxID=2493669 RepID=UPI001AEC96DE|nr:hypothetical protein [Mesorhizobium sp. M1D.F.Ca.ET.043.01.1.1]